jgi:hypothetical protein
VTIRVAFADEVEHSLKLRPSADRCNLLGENLLASGGGEVSDLGIEARLLLHGAGSSVANFQTTLLSQLKLYNL